MNEPDVRVEIWAWEIKTETNKRSPNSCSLTGLVKICPLSRCTEWEWPKNINGSLKNDFEKHLFGLTSVFSFFPGWCLTAAREKKNPDATVRREVDKLQSAAGQRSPFLLEDKFGLMQEKRAKAEKQVNTCVNRVAIWPTQHRGQTTAVHTLHFKKQKWNPSKGQITGYENCWSFSLKFILYFKKTTTSTQHRAHSAHDF